MSDNTAIEWADATVNAVNGCSVLSPGCTNCYAMRLAGTRLRHHPTREGLTTPSNAGPVWNGTVRLHEPALLQPLKWQRPRRIFWNAHGDLFHEAVPDAWIDRVFAVCALTPQHTHMILTKRSARMRKYFRSRRYPDGDALYGFLHGPLMSIVERAMQRAIDAVFPLPNVALGISAEDQPRANQRIPDLLATPAAMRFVSAEPLLGEIDLTNIRFSNERGGEECWDALSLNGATGDDGGVITTVDWVIAGGESGSGARPMHPAWARSLRDQCAAAGVPFHFKQWGEWTTVCEMSEELIDAVYHPAPERHPEATRRCKVNQCVLHADGVRFNGDAMFRWPAFKQGSGAMSMFAVGKKRAGRLLDGRTHDEFPA